MDRVNENLIRMIVDKTAQKKTGPSERFDSNSELRSQMHTSDFATINALVRTASIFHCLWLLNANSIAVAVLPKTVLCYTEAQCLVEAQELKEPTASTPEGRGGSHRGDIIVLVKRFLTNARLVCGFYENNIRPVHEHLVTEGVDVTKWPLLERTPFIRSLYHLKALAVVREYSDASCPVLSHTGQRELIDISELASWFRREATLQRRVELGVESLLQDNRWLQKWMDVRWAAIRGRSNQFK
ncbi:MAG: hypothetical protein Q9213_001994 [Squamulea squamosa]